MTDPDLGTRLPVRPTPALVRGIVLTGLFALGAVLLAKPVAAVLAAPFAVYVGWAAWRRPAAGTVTVDVNPPLVRVHEDDSVAVTTTVSGPGFAPSFTTASWPLRSGLKFDPPKAALVAGPGEGVPLVIEPRTWGRYQVGPAQVTAVDDSGAWRAAGQAAAVGVVVRPSAASLEGSSGIARPLGIAGLHSSHVKGEGSLLADLREFRLGDRLRRINWRVTSRTSRLHVTTTYQERDTDVLVVIDTLHDVPGAKSSSATSLDLAVRAVAAVARHYIGFGDRVAVHDLGVKMRQVRGGTGSRHLSIVIDALSRIERTVHPTLAGRPVPAVTPGTLVFFCSPFVDPIALTELGRLHRLGADIVAIDTLPATVGTVASLRRSRATTYVTEAWAIRRMERADVFWRLEHTGIPVVPWRGPGSLSGVLVAMEAARRAPRMGRR